MAAKEILTVLKLDGKQFTKGLSDTTKTILKTSASISAAGASILYAAKQTANFQDQNIKLSRAAGVTSEAFSGLSHAADLSGVSTNDLTMALGKLSTPAGAASKAMEEMGIKTTDAEGKMLSTEDLLGKFADKIQSLEDPAARAGAAIKVFGESGGRMVNMLAAGSEGLAEMQLQAEKLGLVVSEKAGKAAEKFNDDISLMGKSAQGLVNQFSTAVISIINQSGALEIASNIIQSITGAWMDLDEETQQIIVTIGLVASGIATLTLAVTGLLPIIASATAAFSPFVLGIAAAVAVISVLTTGIMKYWDTIKGVLAPMKAAFSDFSDTVMDIVDPVTDFFRQTAEAVADWAGLSDIFGDAGDNISYLGTAANVAIKILSSGAIVLLRGWQAVLLLVREIGQSFIDLINFEFTAASLDRVKNTMVEIGDTIRKGGDDLKNTWGGGTLVKVKQDVDNAKKSMDDLAESSRDVASNLVDISKFRDSATGSIAKAADDIKTVWNNKFKEGKALSLKEQATSIANSAAGIVQTVASLASSITDIFAAQAEQVAENIRRTNDKIQWSYQVLGVLTKKRNEQELIELEKQEQEKINIIKNAANERILALDEEYQRAKEIREREFDEYVAQEKAKFDTEKQRLLDLTDERGQHFAVNAAMEENWQIYLESLKSEHDTNMLDLQSEYNDKTAEEQEAANAQVQTAEEAAAAKKEALRQKQEAAEKRHAKEVAFIQWASQVMAFEVTKNVQATQTMIQGIAGAAQAFATTVGMMGPLGLAVGAGIAALIIANASVASNMIRSAPPPPPPAELFAETGGVLSGPSHAAGGIAVRAEGDEGIIDKIRTRKLIQSVDSTIQTNNGQNSGDINITFEKGAFQNNGPMDEKTADMVSNTIARRLERQGIGQI